MPGDREINIQQELYFNLRKVIEEERDTLGMKLDSVTMEYPVDGGRADIVVFTTNRQPFLVIETKKKGDRVSRQIDPLSFTVIQQALGYATLLGSPYIATANREFFSSFVVPHLEPFSIERHRVLITQFETMNKDIARNILKTTIQFHLANLEQKKQIRTGLDWTFIIRLRSFVAWLSPQVQSSVNYRLRHDSDFAKKINEFQIQKATRLTSQHLAHQMSYLLMNRVLFYKVLERHYPSLPKMDPFHAPTIESYVRVLQEFFDKAMQETKDFEAIFHSDIYDDITIEPAADNLTDTIDGINTFMADMERYKIEEIGADIIGYVYEELLTPQERVSFGQFYTPPPVAELISRWAIREGSDIVLEPAVGSGTFVIQAYKALKNLKKKEATEDTSRLHEQLLKQLFAIDVNPFPAHLTAVNLAMRDVKHPVSEMNVLQGDFFKVQPRQVVFASYSIKTPSGTSPRQFQIPWANAVIANPPYTRWTELADSSRETITKAIGRQLSEYGMNPGSVRSEPALYTHFVMHGFDFLNEDGRLGMIISNSWLQTDYGIHFGRFLLDNFSVAAIIDFSARIFTIPLVSTLVILAQRETDKRTRDANKTSFMYIDQRADADPDAILEALENPSKYSKRFFLNVFEQHELRSGNKWIDVLFGTQKLLQSYAEHAKTVASDYFDITRGNSAWSFWAVRHGSRPDIGTKNFFYLTEDGSNLNGLQDFSYPALTSVRYSKHFVFDKKDWEQLRGNGKDAFFFICHQRKSSLSAEVRDYIRWGETKCKTMIRGERGGGGVCSEATSCKAREKWKGHFFGWYDLGKPVLTPIMAVYQSQYRTRFFYCTHSVVTYHAVVTFKPKVDYTEPEYKAVLAILNSSFARLYVEARGRSTALGLIALEFSQAEKIPIPNIRKIPRPTVKALADAFDSLEKAARANGGADTRQKLERLEIHYQNLDEVVADALGLSAATARRCRILADKMMERRLARVNQESDLLGASDEEEPSMTRPRTRSSRTDYSELGRLDDYTG